MRTFSFVLVLLFSGAFLDRAVINPAPLHFVASSQWHGIEVENHVMADEYIEASITHWKTEVTRRFPNALIIVGHGGDVNGIWNMELQDKGGKLVPVAKIAAEARLRNPGRVIVLLCCNPNGHLLHIPGVYHAFDSVWFTPDKDINGQPDEEKQAHDQDRTDVGNIFEFSDDCN